MKKTALFLSLAAALALALPAQAQSSDGMFANVSVGQAKVDRSFYNDDATAWNLNMGYRWATSPSTLIGFEVGYADLGSFAADSFWSDNAQNLGKGELKGWNLGANIHANLTPNWYVSARGGMLRGRISGSLPVGMPNVETGAQHYEPVKGNDNTFYAGVGFGYDVSETVSVGMNYDAYRAEVNSLKLDPKVWSLSTEVRF